MPEPFDIGGAQMVTIPMAQLLSLQHDAKVLANLRGAFSAKVRETIASVESAIAKEEQCQNQST